MRYREEFSHSHPSRLLARITGMASANSFLIGVEVRLLTSSALTKRYARWLRRSSARSKWSGPGNVICGCMSACGCCIGKGEGNVEGVQVDAGQRRSVLSVSVMGQSAGLEMVEAPPKREKR